MCLVVTGLSVDTPNCDNTVSDSHVPYNSGKFSFCLFSLITSVIHI